MLRKKLLTAGISAGAGLLLLLAFVVGGTAVNRARTGSIKPWNDKAFKAKYPNSAYTGNINMMIANLERQLGGPRKQ